LSKRAKKTTWEFRRGKLSGLCVGHSGSRIADEKDPNSADDGGEKWSEMG